MKSSILSQKQKKDKWFQGTTLEIKGSRNNASLAVFKLYIHDCLNDSHQRPNQDTPLFCDDQGNALTIDSVINELHMALKKSGLSTHGVTSKVCRRGGAQQAFSVGGKSLVKELGRWTSDSWKTYVQQDTPTNHSLNKDHEDMWASIIYHGGNTYPVLKIF
jgi:hypothetical protein